MYSVLLPKFKDDKSPFLTTSIVQLIFEYILTQSQKYAVIMMPGFLSKTEKTIDYFTNNIFPSNNGSSQFKFNFSNIYLGLVTGMLSDASKNNSKDNNNSKNKNNQLSSRDIYQKHISNFKNKKINIIDINDKFTKDHRKAIFVFKVDNDTTCDDFKFLNQKDIDIFIQRNLIEFILIGSSNQSCTTYFGNDALNTIGIADKGELDILLFNDHMFIQKLDKLSTNSKYILTESIPNSKYDRFNSNSNFNENSTLSFLKNNEWDNFSKLIARDFLLFNLSIVIEELKINEESKDLKDKDTENNKDLDKELR